MKLTVIICTHNPRKEYLRRTLEALRTQALPSDQWELLLIDNASNEVLEEKWDLSWHPHARHIRENELGLTPARLRGIAEAMGDLLVFVDDDNVLQADYLTVLMDLDAAHAKLGCFGAGILEPEFEVEPAPKLRHYTGSLALRSVDLPQWSNIPTDAIIPWGAGLAVRRTVAKRYLTVVQGCAIRKSLGRSGQNLNSGEDDEFSWIACELGLGKGLFPSLRITHLIDQRRVEERYLLALETGHAFSRTFLNYLHHQPLCAPSAPSTFSDVIGNLLRAKLSLTLYHANSWWSSRHTPSIEKAFKKAWRTGFEHATNELNR